MLDKLPASIRHFSLLLIAAILAWIVQGIPNIDPILGSLLGALATFALVYVTPLTRQYGVGSDGLTAHVIEENSDIANAPEEEIVNG